MCVWGPKLGVSGFKGKTETLWTLKNTSLLFVYWTDDGTERVSSRIIIVKIQMVVLDLTFVLSTTTTVSPMCLVDDIHSD